MPEIVETIRALPVRDLILDENGYAYNPDGRPHPFQVTMRRFGRKLAVDESRATLPLQAFFFDCLRTDGRSLVDRPARERFAAMASALPESLHIPRLVTRDLGEARAFYEAALAAGHEGVMAKSSRPPTRQAIAVPAGSRSSVPTPSTGGAGSGMGTAVRQETVELHPARSNRQPAST